MTPKNCPHCKREGLTVEADFGYRTIRGKKVPQPWCRPCRNGSKPKPVGLVIQPSDTVELTEDRYTQCDDCRVRFTKDPVAAGWHEAYAGAWDCHVCWREDLTYITMRFTERSTKYILAPAKRSCLNHGRPRRLRSSLLICARRRMMTCS
jgi:hypothetical protein